MSERQEQLVDLSVSLPDLGQRWRAGQLNAAEFAAHYFLYWQMALHGREFASRRHRRDARPDAEAWLAALDAAEGERRREHLRDWLERYQFRGVAEKVPASLVHWLRGAWPLVLREDIPDAGDVLRMQARGQRPVTIITDWPRARERVLTKPDAFQFFLHDLEHAYKFCHSPELYAGQRDFFARLEAAISRGVFAPYLADAEFRARFHYLMGDMNTHPEHSRQYLRAILIDFYGRCERCTGTGRLSESAERTIEGVMGAVHEVGLRGSGVDRRRGE